MSQTHENWMAIKRIAIRLQRVLVCLSASTLADALNLYSKRVWKQLKKQRP